MTQRQFLGPQYHQHAGFHVSNTSPGVGYGSSDNRASYDNSGVPGLSLPTPQNHASLNSSHLANAFQQSAPGHDTLMEAERALWSSQEPLHYQTSTKPQDIEPPVPGNCDNDLLSPMGSADDDMPLTSYGLYGQDIEQVTASAPQTMATMYSNARRPPLCTVPEGNALQIPLFREPQYPIYQGDDLPRPSEGFPARMVQNYLLPPSHSHPSTRLPQAERRPVSCKRSLSESGAGVPTNDRPRHENAGPNAKRIKTTQAVDKPLQIQFHGSSQVPSQRSSRGSFESLDGSSSSQGRRTRNLTQEQREHANNVRKIGACEECHERKVKVRSASKRRRIVELTPVGSVNTCYSKTPFREDWQTQATPQRLPPWTYIKCRDVRSRAR